MKGILGLLLAISATAAGSVHAENWVLCGDCTGPLQLQQAAKAAHGLTRGTEIYAVGNPNLLTFTYYEVTYTPGGGPGPAATGLAAKSGTSSASSLAGVTADGIKFIGTVSTTTALSAAQADARVAAQVAAAGGSQTAVGIAPTQVERQQYEAIVRMSKDRVMIRPEDSSGYFASFDTAYFDSRAALDQVILTALTINNPAWRVGPLTKLWQALRGFDGRMPIGCVVFTNGESACFQVNPAAPGASRVLDGTATDIDGDPIEVGEGDTLPNGSGVSVVPNLNTPTVGQVTYLNGTDPNAPKIVCGYVNGGLDKCRVVFP